MNCLKCRSNTATYGSGLGFLTIFRLLYNTFSPEGNTHSQTGWETIAKD